MSSQPWFLVGTMKSHPQQNAYIRILSMNGGSATKLSWAGDANGGPMPRAITTGISIPDQVDYLPALSVAWSDFQTKLPNGSTDWKESQASKGKAARRAALELAYKSFAASRPSPNPSSKSSVDKNTPNEMSNGAGSQANQAPKRPSLQSSSAPVKGASSSKEDDGIRGDKKSGKGQSYADAIELDDSPPSRPTRRSRSYRSTATQTASTRSFGTQTD